MPETLLTFGHAKAFSNVLAFLCNNSVISPGFVQHSAFGSGLVSQNRFGPDHLGRPWIQQIVVGFGESAVSGGVGGGRGSARAEGTLRGGRVVAAR